MKITLIEPILNFTGSTQESSYGTDVTSRSLDRTQLPNGETYGYRLERYVDPFGN